MKRLPLVINVRGNNGSGKSFLTRQFMTYCTKVEPVQPGSKVLGYEMKLFKRQRWFVVGSYESECGGADNVAPLSTLIKRIDDWTQVGFNVWVEGIIISDCYGALGTYSELYGNRWVFAYLNTPVEVCLQRVIERRQRKDNRNEYDPHKTLYPRQHRIELSHAKIIGLERRVIDLDWKQPLIEILTIIRKEG